MKANILYNQYIIKRADIGYLPSAHISSDEIFTDFHKANEGAVNDEDTLFLIDLLSDFDKRWFVFHLLSVVCEITDSLANKILDVIIGFHGQQKYLNSVLQNLCRIKGYPFVENKLLSLYSSYDSLILKTCLHVHFLNCYPQLEVKWSGDGELRPTDIYTKYKWDFSKSRYVNVWESFDVKSHEALRLQTEHLFKQRILVLCENLLKMNFNIEDQLILISLIPRNMVFRDADESNLYEKANHKIQSIEKSINHPSWPKNV